MPRVSGKAPTEIEFGAL